MKNLILIAALMISSSAFADTIGQKTASDMSSLLQYREVQDLLAQKSGASNLTAITRVAPMESMSSADYELTFQSTSGLSSSQSCTCKATVSSGTVTSFQKGNCN